MNVVMLAALTEAIYDNNIALTGIDRGMRSGCTLATMNAF
jgi:hypothetical protein